MCVWRGAFPPVMAHHAPKRAQHAECVPLSPHAHECAWHTEPVLLPRVPTRSIRVRSLPFHPVESSSVVRSPPVHPGARDAPSPCARDPARATPRAPAHAHPARSRHTSDPHLGLRVNPNTSLVQLESQEESTRLSARDTPSPCARTPSPVTAHLGPPSNTKHLAGSTRVTGRVERRR